MIIESPLLRHPSEFGTPDPTLTLMENECFIEEQLLEYWLVSYMLGERARGVQKPDGFLTFIRDPWEVEEVAELVRHAIAGRTVRINASHEPGTLFIFRGNHDEFYVYEDIGEALNHQDLPVFLMDAQRLEDL